MKTYVVTEGASDVALFERLISRGGAGDVVVMDSKGKSNASSLARSLLAARRGRVVLILDADTSDAGRAAELRADLDAALGMVADRSSFAVILVAPELEALVMRDDVWAAAGQTPLSEGDRELARVAPKVVLMKRLGTDRPVDFFRSLPEAALERLWAADELRPLFDALTRRAA